MARTKKVLQEVYVETFEYKNVTANEIMYIGLHDGSHKVVEPGDSIMLTALDIERLKTINDRRFTEGKLRRVGGDDDTSNLELSDDLSQVQIRAYVNDTNDVGVFKNALSNVENKSTVELLMSAVEEFDKPVSFYKALDERLTAIEEKIMAKIEGAKKSGEERHKAAQKRLANKTNKNVKRKKGA